MRTKTLGTWLLAAALMGAAFLAGIQLRAHQTAFDTTPPDDTSVQASALLKFTPECSPVDLPDSKQPATKNRELVSSVLRLLKTHYVERVTGERETAMARGAVRCMLNSLADPDSRFVDPDERKLVDDACTGEFHGIGAVLALKKEKEGELDFTKIIVVAPMPGSPAEEADLKPGDSITHIDGKWIVTHDPFKEPELQEMAKAARNKEIDEFTYQKAYEAAFKKLKEGTQISEALEALTLKPSGELSLRVERRGQRDAIDLKLQCRNTHVEPVSARALEHGVKYVRVTQFSKLAAKEFAAELDRARAEGARALILDLRGNPGGLMESAVEIASRITGGGVIGNVESNTGRRIIRTARASKPDLPVAVLVNGGTASVAELVAGTLRDNASATLVGTSTFGDGLTQTPLLLGDGSAAIVTTGKMLTAKGFDFNGKGLRPDREVPEDERRGDVQLKEAEKTLRAKLGET